MMTQAQTRSAIAHIAHAIRPYLGAPPCEVCGGGGKIACTVTVDNCPAPWVQALICPCNGFAGSTTRLALEIARNALGPILMGDRPFHTIASLIMHRKAHGWLVCDGIGRAAYAGAKALGRVET